MKRFVRGAAMALAMVSATAAQAVALTSPLVQVVHFTTGAANTSQILAFNKFDAGVLGAGTRYTLTGVTLSYTPVAVAPLSQITITSNSGNRRLLIANVTATSTVSSGSLFSFGNTISGTSQVADFQTGVAPGGANGLSRTVGIAYNPLTSIGSAIVSNLTPYIGTGTIAVTNGITNFASNVTTTVGGAGNATFTSGQVDGDFTVTYAFIDNLPEPGTWVTMIMGFGLIGTAMRKRQASVAA